MRVVNRLSVVLLDGRTGHLPARFGVFRPEQVREIIDQSLRLAPMAGTAEAALPGTMEWRRE
jgi:hypothetical protein